MNAISRQKENWRKRPLSNNLGEAIPVTSRISKHGMDRAAKVFQILLAVTAKAGRGGRGLWRFLMIRPSLRIQKAPGEFVEIHEEYKSLRQEFPVSTFLKF